MKLWISLLATLVSMVFATLVYHQYSERGRPYQLVWSIALYIFAMGTFCQLLAEIGGWTAAIYRIWYFFGAMLGAAYLGQGTLYLLAPRRWAHLAMAALVVVTLIGVVLVVSLPVDLAKAIQDGDQATGQGFPKTLLLLLIPLNTYGTVVLVGGAIWSGWRFGRGHGFGRRAIGNALIAVGAIVTALGGTLTRLGIPELLYVTELVGVIIIFIGYVQTTAQPSPARQARQSEVSA